jgi:bifunctional UDP-N-acetylglucosamine pyrophosphorylase/glucosamine-1-phosphate N-acetyltransferase
VTVVVGHRAEEVKRCLLSRPQVRFVDQSPQLGTAHALSQAEPVLADAHGTVLLLSGDVPLLRPETLQRVIQAHSASSAAVTVATAVVEKPYGYGRIIRTRGQIARIVEERDASPAERRIREVNSGIYAFEAGQLWDALRSIDATNAQGERYLTDIVSINRRWKRPVGTVVIEDAGEIRGVNTLSELAEVSMSMRQKKNEELMAAGVTIIDPATTYIDPDVMIGSDTVVHPGVVIQGQTRIGAACEIQAYVRLVDSELADNVTILNFCVVTGARIAKGTVIGPFAHLRPTTDVGERVKIGNFVELKRTTIGQGSKAGHLSYLGNAIIGANVNVGAGTITCNYDGEQKHDTVIEDNAFIGSDSQLIAPVRVGRGAYVGAGSSITSDVPPGALGIARGRQANVDGWAERRKGSAKKS